MEKEEEKRWDGSSDRILRTLLKSKGPLTAREVKERLKDDADFEVTGLLVFHYGLVKLSGGRYSLSEQGRKAAKAGIRRYLKAMEGKQKREKVRREILTGVCGGIIMETLRIVLHYLLPVL